MTDQQSPKDPEPQQANRQADLNITIGGNVGPGSALGQDASVRAENISGRDTHVVDHSVDNRQQAAPKTPEDLSKMLDELRGIIEKAHQAGELEADTASKVIENVQVAADMASQPQLPKKSLLRRLQDVADLLDAAAKAIEKAGGVATVVQEAIPMVALLLDLVNLVF